MQKFMEILLKFDEILTRLKRSEYIYPNMPLTPHFHMIRRERRQQDMKSRYIRREEIRDGWEVLSSAFGDKRDI